MFFKNIQNKKKNMYIYFFCRNGVLDASLNDRVSSRVASRCNNSFFFDPSFVSICCKSAARANSILRFSHAGTCRIMADEYMSPRVFVYCTHWSDIRTIRDISRLVGSVTRHEFPRYFFSFLLLEIKMRNNKYELNI